MKWSELIRDCAWAVEDLLTIDECDHLRQRAISLDIHNRKSAGDTRHRNSTTVAFDEHALSITLFERIKPFIPQEVWVDEGCSNPGLVISKEQLYGRWRPVGLNERWRIACYNGRGHFGPHRDGCYMVNENLRSLITINGFLTDRPPGFGGATRFVKDGLVATVNEDGIYSAAECDVLHRVEAERAGTASVFFHDLMHDGEPLKRGSPPKWLFRTEIMYERDPSTAPKMSDEQIRARKYLAQAEEAECRGDIQEATSLYKKAYKLDRSLESIR